MTTKFDLAIFASNTTVSIMPKVRGIVLDANEIPWEPGLWEVCRVLVEDKYQRQGYGRKMLEMLFKHLRDNTEATHVGVNPGGYDGNTKRQFAFYKNCGFEDAPGTPGRLIYKFNR